MTIIIEIHVHLCKTPKLRNLTQKISIVWTMVIEWREIEHGDVDNEVMDDLKAQ
jgi:hypothetical protein